MASLWYKHTNLYKLPGIWTHSWWSSNIILFPCPHHFEHSRDLFHLCNNESSWQSAHMLLNGTLTPRSKVLFKQRWRDTRECLWGRMKELDGKIESNQCLFVLCTTFTQYLFRSWGICEENTWIKFNYSTAELYNAVAASERQSINQGHKCFARRQTLQLYETVYALAFLQTKHYTHTCKCCLSHLYLHASATSVLIYKSRCFRTKMNSIHCRWVTITDHWWVWERAGLCRDTPVIGQSHSNAPRVVSNDYFKAALSKIFQWNPTTCLVLFCQVLLTGYNQNDFQAYWQICTVAAHV